MVQPTTIALGSIIAPETPFAPWKTQGKPFTCGHMTPKCSIPKHTFSNLSDAAQTQFRHIGGLCALIPTLMGAKKALGGWVRHPNIKMHPAKLIWSKVSKPPVWPEVRL